MFQKGRTFGMALAAIALCGTMVTGAAAGRMGSASALHGGVYRTAVQDLRATFTDSLDPTGEYSGLAWGLYSQLLLRTLVTYRHVDGVKGTVVVPDIATDTGTVSPDGLTYTFHLKRGVRFGPPLDRPVTSQDVAYAFERMETSSLVAEYAFYYQGTIAGFHLHPGPPRPISGIQTPDPTTIVFHLTRPTGDFVDRLALPATAPVPEEVAGCFHLAGGYGRDLVSTGPYMIQGADRVDASSCRSIRPMRGYDPSTHLTLVRNPDYDPSTDSPAVRQNFIDGVRIGVDPSAADIFRRIHAGQLDGSFGTAPPPVVVRRYLRDPSLRGLLHANGNDSTWYLPMNLLVPPFNDVHVRRAVNWAIDKAAIQAAFGATTMDIATNAFPPGVLPATAGYDPYATPGERGDLQRARSEMARSGYDPDHDGVCDAQVCRDVRFLTRNYGPFAAIVPSIEKALAGIGITLKVKEVDAGTGYTELATIGDLVPFSGVPGWIKDYTDPYTFADFLFRSSSGCYVQNYANVGLTLAVASECGVLVQWKEHPPPSVDRQVATCEAASGDARTSCWVAFDHLIMEKMVPWVPYRWGRVVTIVAPTVSRFVFDGFTGTVSLCHLALGGT